MSAAVVRKKADTSQRDALVLQHLKLVKVLAIKLAETLPVYVDLDDLIHAGMMGLMEAAAKFDTAKSIKFGSYAKYRIRGAMLDSLRQLDWATRDTRRRRKQVEAAVDALEVQLCRAPTQEEVAEKLGIAHKKWHRMLSQVDLSKLGLISLSCREAGEPPLDPPGNPDLAPDLICARAQLGRMLQAAAEKLSDRYQRILRMYYVDELTMREIAGVIGVNESRICQIHKAALAKLRASLIEAGTPSTAAFV